MIIQGFYALLAALTLFSAVMVVAFRHAIYSALFLVLTMISMAGLFIMMNAQLAAAFQVIVYAGAIMVLFMFVIMLLQVGHQGGWSAKTRATRWWGALLALAFAAQGIAAVLTLKLGDKYTLQNAAGIDIKQVAGVLMTDYIYAFEMTSVLLLVAVVGAVVLARRFLVQGRPKAGENHF